jgi:hypothetical protein
VISRLSGWSLSSAMWHGPSGTTRSRRSLCGTTSAACPSSGDSHRGVISAAAGVCSCVDNSGVWGGGGVFRALQSVSSVPAQLYERAGEVKDLREGQVHLASIVGCCRLCDGLTFLRNGRL